MEETFKNPVEDGLDTNPGKEDPKRVHLFNCDKTYNLDSVEKLFCEVNDDIRKKLSFDIQLPIRKNYFPLSKIPEMCETTIPQLQIDFAVFVIHAHESRLSINEDNAGIGYAKIYRALIKATDENVLIVIGGDDQYSNRNEEERSVISPWARRKISSQFQDEFMDGRKSFIFSWNKKHRAIHEDALLHYFDPSKKGEKFEYQQQNPSEVSTRGKESDAENKNMPVKGDHRHQEQKVKDNADRHAKSSSRVKKNKQAPGTPVTPEQGPVREVDKEMPKKEKQSHLLPADDEFVHLKIPEEEYVDVNITDATNSEAEAAASKAGVQPKGETLLLKTRLQYGQISDRDDDKLVSNEQWTPPDELLSGISDRFKDVAEADLEIYRVEETGVIRVKIMKPSFIYAIIDFVSNVIKWIFINTWHVIQQVRGLEAEPEEEEAVVEGQPVDGFAMVNLPKGE